MKHQVNRYTFFFHHAWTSPAAPEEVTDLDSGLVRIRGDLLGWSQVRIHPAGTAGSHVSLTQEMKRPVRKMLLVPGARRLLVGNHQLMIRSARRALDAR